MARDYKQSAIEKYNNLSNEQIQRIIDVFDSTNRIEAHHIMKDEFGLTQVEARIISQILREKGKLRNKLNNKWSQSELEIIKQMVDTGHLLSEIASALNKNYVSIRKKVLELYGKIPVIDIEGEEWKRVGETDYEISNCGRLRRKGYRRLTNGSVGRDGYIQVAINKQCLRMHRLVAQAFIPNPEGKELVDHIDGNRTNNHVSNLRWVTAEENANNEHRTQEQKKAAELRKLEKEVNSLLNKRVRQLNCVKLLCRELLGDNPERSFLGKLRLGSMPSLSFSPLVA